MALMRDFRAGIESRASIENPAVPLSAPIPWLLGGHVTASRIPVNPEIALRVSAVYACVQLISSTVGSIPAQVCERTFTAKNQLPGKRIAFEHPLYSLLAAEPNEEMAAITFFKTLQAHHELWGNAYAEIQRDGGMRPVALWPRSPSKTRPFRIREAHVVETINGPANLAAGQLVYRTTDGMGASDPNPESMSEAGPERTILAEDMVHIPNLSLDARIGQETIHLAREAVGLSIAAEQHAATFFGNGAFPIGFFSHPGALKEQAKKNIEHSINTLYSGRRAHRAGLLEEGLDYKQVSVNPNEAQLNETRQYQNSVVCQYFGLPPHMIGDSDKSNRANTEQLSLEFAIFSMRPRFLKWTQELDRKVFSSLGRNSGKFFTFMDPQVLIFPDAESRTSLYSNGKQNGYLSTNDIRYREGLNPIDEDWANDFWVQINMQPAKTAYGEPAQGPGEADRGDPTDEPENQDEDKPAGKLGQRMTAAYFRLFRDSFGRITARSSADSGAFTRAFLPVFESIADQIYRFAKNEFGSEQIPQVMSPRFVSDYLAGMVARFDEWKNANGNADELAKKELVRAVRAISIEVFRTIATDRAKVLTGGTEQ